VKAFSLFAIAIVLASGLRLAAPVYAGSAYRPSTAECVPTITARGRVDVWPGPNLRHRVPVTAMARGDLAFVTGRLRDSSWYRVVFEEQEGWVQARLVAPACVQLVPVVPPSAVAAPSQPGANFQARPALIVHGTCSTLFWRAPESAAVHFVEGERITDVTSVSARVVCPVVTTAYMLHVQPHGEPSFFEVAIVTVARPPTSTPTATPTPVPTPTLTPMPQPDFRADLVVLLAGQCTTLRWHVEGVRAVYLWDGANILGVIGIDNRVVCPQVTTTYVLRAQRLDGTTFDMPVTMTVIGGGSNPNFRADSGTINAGQCTTLRWNIDGVRGVWFWDPVSRNGVSGNDVRQVCPGVTTTYRLEVLRNDGVTSDFLLTVMVIGAPALPTQQP
jgi:hypothetical protein